MCDVTYLWSKIERGDRQASEQLLPLVDDELRRLATYKMASESPDHTLQPTALVHEAYLRLVGDGVAKEWNGRGHFFCAAAEAMRRILVERARLKATAKAGGHMNRVELRDAAAQGLGESELDMVALDEALKKLESKDPR